MRLLLCLPLLLTASLVLAQESSPRFRTDADGPVSVDAGRKGLDPNDPLKWYSLVDGQFPPEGSGHAVSGELIQVDHLERRFLFRVDRNDHQLRGDWDLPIDAVMLPYGAIYYHGAPADIRDLPLGTHLHGEFYLRSPDDLTPHPPGPNSRQTPEVDFRQCFKLEDDFSYHRRQNQIWRVDSIDRQGMKMSASLEQDGKVIGQPKTFDLLDFTEVYLEDRRGDLDWLQPGQAVLFNLTWATLYGPGRVTAIWIDEASREHASELQRARHRDHIRLRGLAGWIDEVDDKQETVTITFFGGIDPSLFDELGTEDNESGMANGALVVARRSLMTFAPTIDKKRVTILKRQTVPLQPGSSGVQIQVQCDMMLEGFRPTRIVRYYPEAWPLVALPREEQYFGRE